MKTYHSVRWSGPISASTCAGNYILVHSNAEVASDPKIMALRALGSDLNINAFGMDFRYPNGTLNDDIEECNYLATRVVEALSLEALEDDLKTMPLILSSTSYEHDLYGSYSTHLQRRLGLRPGAANLTVLRNVVQSPFATRHGFVYRLVGEFRKVVEKEFDYCVKRNEECDDYHELLKQGTETVYLLGCPKFYEAKHRRQLVFSVQLPKKVKHEYAAVKRVSPEEPLLLVTAKKVDLSTVFKEGGLLYGHVKSDYSGILLHNLRAQIVSVLKDRSLRSHFRDPTFPSVAPFYLYGSNSEKHLDHVVMRAPKVRLTAEDLIFEPEIPAAELSRGAVTFADDVCDVVMQPFPAHAEVREDGRGALFFVFRSGARLAVTVYTDAHKLDALGPGLFYVKAPGRPLACEELVLGEKLVVDAYEPNQDPFPRPQEVNALKEDFAKIGKGLA